MPKHRALSAVIAITTATALATVSAPIALAGPDDPSGRDATRALPPPAGENQYVARGRGGAVSSVDANATRIGVKVLKAGGTATDAAVATAAALGVTEPYSTGIGGGGYFVHYNARSGKVQTIDGRETAPAAFPHDAFIDPETGEPYPFFPDRVTSGVSVGTPGTLATWKAATDRWGKRSLAGNLRPATNLARKGFTVDQTFYDQTEDNAERFAAFTSTSDLYLPGGEPPAVGSRFRNPDLARTYDKIAAEGPKAFYRGAMAREIASAVQDPPTTGESDLPVPPGHMTVKDLNNYDVRSQRPTHLKYHGLDVYGMAPSSSGGTTVGEALNILENFRLGKARTPRSLHAYLEASATAFADRGAYVGDSAFNDVPTDELTSQKFADGRACTIDPDQAAEKPVPAGEIDGDPCATDASPAKPDAEGLSTSHLSVVDKWGNAVAYTLTIEQTGGSGILVPGRGFLLNNELTDFSAEYEADDPNRPQAYARPRSSMSPTIVLDDGELKLLVGSPGGSTIITTVLQVLLNRLDLDMNLPQAVAAPRASQRNTAEVSAEPEFIDAYGAALEKYGHVLVPSGDEFTPDAEIGAVAAIEVRPNGNLVAVAEPTRRGGGTAGVVRPR
ncbi:gamma-glutamyltransferase [Solicola gregarius]|uniref:Glutathione hydrolase proenzyme n=1 Tax=Solicola gregarius TaxID=2908642 RepID=A0AA46TG57_9ACTN|nr:gamma-glutamyltransferase [Solicola gregarius]UYM04578.1 gamma-glutamyltransferase [Solicola gregarius]